MKIGLIDVDGHNFPNFALMRLSAWHKAHGDSVEWADAMFGLDYDRVYKSKIFTFSPDDNTPWNCEVVRGGTGYDVKSRLPIEVEQSTMMDYSLYPQYDFSIQFFSRGCIRHCPFCLVHDKEGGIHPVEPVDLNPHGKHIEVLDNNFFANPEWKSAVDYLLKVKQKVNLHGVDVRIMNEEQDLYRIERCRELGIKPYVMPYRDFENKTKPSQYAKDLAQYVNKPMIFKSCKFEDFSPRKGFVCREYYNH